MITRQYFEMESKVVHLHIRLVEHSLVYLSVCLSVCLLQVYLQNKTLITLFKKTKWIFLRLEESENLLSHCLREKKRCIGNKWMHSWLAEQISLNLQPTSSPRMRAEYVLPKRLDDFPSCLHPLFPYVLITRCNVFITPLNVLITP